MVPSHGPCFYVAYQMWHLNSIDDVKFWFYYSMVFNDKNNFFLYFRCSEFRVFWLHYWVIAKSSRTRPLTHVFLCSVSSLPVLWLSFIIISFPFYISHEYSMFGNSHSFLSFTEGCRESLNYCRGNKTNIVWTKNCILYIRRA